jgi:hypothetical protein
LPVRRGWMILVASITWGLSFYILSSVLFIYYPWFLLLVLRQHDTPDRRDAKDLSKFFQDSRSPGPDLNSTEWKGERKIFETNIRTMPFTRYLLCWPTPIFFS